MNENETRRGEADKEVVGFDLLGVMRDYRRAILRAVTVVTGVVALLGGLYLWVWQPVANVWTLEFRPTFEGAATGTYPNGLSFTGSDITAPSIINTVYDRNEIQKYCGRDEFRSAFFVQQQSLEAALLDLEFQARLAEVRLTAVERERLQNEYRARRAVLPVVYRLVFVRPAECDDVPSLLVEKSLNDVLLAWAEESETKRGVLNVQVAILSPASLDVAISENGSRLIRADLVRTALRRLEENVEAVELIPGASQVRLGDNRTTFAELRGRLRDLIQARLEPLVIAAGRSLGSESLAWVEEALASAAREQQVAEGKARAYLDALREYSGTPQAPTTAEGQQIPGSSDVQTLMPQIDRTFIDRILEMSEANTTFRQEMTRLMVEANIDAVEHSSNVTHYRHMAEALRRPGAATFSVAAIDQRLQEIVDEGKRLAAEFTALTDEFSRVALRVSPMLYEIERPVTESTQRGFTFRMYLVVIALVFVIALFLAFIVALVDRRVRAVPVAR